MVMKIRREIEPAWMKTGKTTRQNSPILKRTVSIPPIIVD